MGTSNKRAKQIWLFTGGLIAVLAGLAILMPPPTVNADFPPELGFVERFGKPKLAPITYGVVTGSSRSGLKVHTTVHPTFSWNVPVSKAEMFRLMKSNLTPAKGWSLVCSKAPVEDCTAKKLGATRGIHVTWQSKHRPDAGTLQIRDFEQIMPLSWYQVAANKLRSLW